MQVSSQLRDSALRAFNPGTVYLIGAGPGDPGLITVRGRDLLAAADVVVYDRLVHPALLKHARPDAERVYVGKSSARHAMKQADISALLVDRARSGRIVARLKGGDPFVFGRGGEEAEACRAAGVAFEVVPGVTSAIAAPAYAGIPVTHRDAASSFSVVTGHERHDSGKACTRAPSDAADRRDWARIAHAADTLIFLMGVESLPEIASRLREHGRAPETPVALVQWGAWPRQRVVVGTLATIVDDVRNADLTPPAVCIVGEVVRMREALRWFDDPSARPLFGRRALVTRAREQASALSDLLMARGAEPVEFPVIRITPVADTSLVDAAVGNLSAYQWIVFTSANAVPIFAGRLEAQGLDARALCGARIAAIGPATAAALRERLGLRADFVPDEAVAEALLAAWPDREMAGRRVLIPRARDAREILPEQLAARGAIVDVVPLYETHVESGEASALRAMLEAGEIDVVTFTSSSTVRNFVATLEAAGCDASFRLPAGCIAAAIGPVTAETARAAGIEPAIVALEHTIPGLVAALERHFRV
ncbi:MAG TPA: uroporphyrinogen-III C-methyltransferase [Chthonomonadaceae bacterium]|nr:uroporphyrinogen-III C-methyltransferase [Chthonomonadaceae bacterium]